jgi:hypothetical protein
VAGLRSQTARDAGELEGPNRHTYKQQRGTPRGGQRTRRTRSLRITETRCLEGGYLGAVMAGEAVTACLSGCFEAADGQWVGGRRRTASGRGCPARRMGPAIGTGTGTGTGGNEDICSGQRLGKRSPGWVVVVGVRSGANTYPVNGQGRRASGSALRRIARGGRREGAWTAGSVRLCWLERRVGGWSCWCWW